MKDQGNAAKQNLEGQEVIEGGGNKKGQGADDLIQKNSASLGAVQMPSPEGSDQNTPKGQKVV